MILDEIYSIPEPLRSSLMERGVVFQTEELVDGEWLDSGTLIAKNLGHAEAIASMDRGDHRVVGQISEIRDVPLSRLSIAPTASPEDQSKDQHERD